MATAWTTADFSGTRWKEQRNYAVYVAKTGHDANNGSPKSPLLTLTAGLALTRSRALLSGTSGDAKYYLVIGTGIYNEAAVYGGVSLIGDGVVEWNGLSASQLDTAPGGVSLTLTNILLRNYISLTLGNSDLLLNFTNCQLVNVGRFTNNGNNIFRSHTYSFTNCRFTNSLQNVTTNDYGGLTLTCDHCTYLNSPFSWAKASNVLVVRNSILDATSPITLALPSTTWAIVNCNIQSTINGATIASYQVTYPNQAYGNVSVAPGFTNPAQGDYSLTPGSAMRNAATDGGYIGANGVGFGFGGQADLDTSVAGGGLVNTQWNSSLNQFVLVDATQKGTIEFVTKDFTRNWALDKISLVGTEDAVDHQTIDAQLSYQTDASGQAVDSVGSGPFTAAQIGQIFWVNGYNTVTYNSITYNTNEYLYVAVAGSFTSTGTGKLVRIVELPNIRTFEMKTSITTAADCVASPWNYFVYGRAATVDSNGNSNGSPLHNLATAVPVVAEFIKIRLTLYPNSIA